MFIKLRNKTSEEVICHLKYIFAMHGIPQQVFWTVILSILLQNFLTSPRSINTTSSPGSPQNNGKAERAVCTIKNLLSKSKDPYAALLAYRSTPIQSGYSPTKLLMSRQLRSSVPLLPHNSNKLLLIILFSKRKRRRGRSDNGKAIVIAMEPEN